MINEKFIEALILIPILAIGLTFEGLRKVLEAPLVFKHKVKSLAAITLNCKFNKHSIKLFLINIYGINGAAYATLYLF
jgi:hypothetical protein